MSEVDTKVTKKYTVMIGLNEDLQGDEKYSDALNRLNKAINIISKSHDACQNIEELLEEMKIRNTEELLEEMKIRIVPFWWGKVKKVGNFNSWEEVQGVYNIIPFIPFGELRGVHWAQLLTVTDTEAYVDDQKSHNMN